MERDGSVTMDIKTELGVLFQAPSYFNRILNVVRNGRSFPHDFCNFPHSNSARWGSLWAGYADSMAAIHSRMYFVDDVTLAIGVIVPHSELDLISLH